MRTFTILRDYHDAGTQGEVLREDGSHVCFCIERSRNGNHPCIEEGEYEAARYMSPVNHGEVWLLQNVPHRTEIEVHIANWPRELLGCIAPGTERATSNLGEPGVSHSGIAFEAFMKETANDSRIKFIIKERT